MSVVSVLSADLVRFEGIREGVDGREEEDDYECDAKQFNAM